MKSVGIFALAWLALAVAAFAGWVMNIVTIMHTDGGINALFIVRCIGIIVAPLGAVLGYI